MTVLALVWYWNGLDPSASNCGIVCSSARKYRPARKASAKLIPSTEIPKPENIGRIVTAPKSENRSARKSRSITSPCEETAHSEREEYAPGLNLGGLQLHRFPTSAGADLVRIVEDELCLQLVGLVVHLGSEQEQHGLWIDQNLDALVFNDLIGRADFVGIFDRVGLAGAATILDADAKANDFGIRASGKLKN